MGKKRALRMGFKSMVGVVDTRFEKRSNVNLYNRHWSLWLDYEKSFSANFLDKGSYTKMRLNTQIIHFIFQ